MKALAVCLFILGAVAMLWNTTSLPSRDATKAQAVALNYVMFRTAVLEHLYRHPDATGDISRASLELPTSWEPMRPWTARVTGGLCLIFGEADADEVTEARRLLHWSRAVGTARGGYLVPGHGVSIPTPEVPDGNLVSVIKLD